MFCEWSKSKVVRGCSGCKRRQQVAVGQEEWKKGRFSALHCVGRAARGLAKWCPVPLASASSPIGLRRSISPCGTPSAMFSVGVPPSPSKRRCSALAMAVLALIVCSRSSSSTPSTAPLVCAWGCFTRSWLASCMEYSTI